MVLQHGSSCAIAWEFLVTVSFLSRILFTFELGKDAVHIKANRKSSITRSMGEQLQVFGIHSPSSEFEKLKNSIMQCKVYERGSC